MCIYITISTYLYSWRKKSINTKCKYLTKITIELEVFFFLAHCAIEDVSTIGDGSCDAEAAGSLCNFDGGDCLSTIIYTTIIYY